MNPAVKKYIQFDGLLLSILWLLLVFSHCDKMFGFLNHSHILWMHMKGTESMFSFFFFHLHCYMNSYVTYIRPMIVIVLDEMGVYIFETGPARKSL